MQQGGGPPGPGPPAQGSAAAAARQALMNNMQSGLQAALPGQGPPNPLATLNPVTLASQIAALQQSGALANNPQLQAAAAAIQANVQKLQAQHQAQQRANGGVQPGQAQQQQWQAGGNFNPAQQRPGPTPAVLPSHVVHVAGAGARPQGSLLPVYGFTQGQLHALKSQILVSNSMAGGCTGIPTLVIYGSTSAFICIGKVVAHWHHLLPVQVESLNMHAAASCRPSVVSRKGSLLRQI